MGAMARRCPALPLALLLAAASGQNRGLDSCPCISVIEGHTGTLVYRPPGSSREYTFPEGYGLGQCGTYDQGREPDCNGAGPPAWCSSPWCYVDANACTGASLVSTRYFPAVETLYYSYTTCAASSNSVRKWTEAQEDASRRMLGLVEGYTRASRWKIEHTFADYQASGNCTGGPSRSMCPCADCAANAVWNNEVSFLKLGFLSGADGTAADANKAECLSQGIATTYLSVAGKEADPNFARVGYQYFADQATGSYTQWPKMDMCPDRQTGFDPRMRPWYAAAATGPKDVLIIVDTSGSMSINDRHVLAKEATKAILDTLTWKDFATIMHFNSRVSDEYGSGTFVPMTDANKDAMNFWMDDRSRSWYGGSTNFRAPMTRAFEIIEASVRAGATSMCQKVIMFLTDGEASFENSDFEEVRRKALQNDAFIFTYALGAEADTVKTKRLACENRGVFYGVSDDDNLANVMSQYYEYFAYGQEMCSASFLRYSGVGGGHELYSACMSMYHRTKPIPELLGVSCTDINLMADIGQLRREPGWNYLSCVASDMTKMCRHVDLSECARQKIRRAYSSASVCEGAEYADAAAETVCPCTEQSCQDNASFTDEKYYFCDTWVGDDCFNPNPTWGYSDAGMAEIRGQCKRSCGLCNRTSGACGRATSEECPVIPVQQECRACLGRTSGVDINDRPMECPPDAPRDLGYRWNQTDVSASASCGLGARGWSWLRLAMLAAAPAWLAGARARAR